MKQLPYKTIKELEANQDIQIIDGDRGKNYPKKEEFKSIGFCVFLNASNIKDDTFVFESIDFISEEKDNLLRKGKLSRNDIIITTRGTVGLVAYYGNNIQYDNIRINSGMIIIRVNRNVINPNYFYQLLKSKSLKKQYQLFASGCAQPQLPIQDFRLISIPVFSKIHQDKIAQILSNYDDLIENNNKRIKILEEMAQKIYKEWFVDFKFPGHETATFKDSPMGKIPTDWEVKKVVELSTLSKGKSYKSSELVDKKDGLPFLNLKCVERDGGFKREGLKWFCGKYNDNHVVLPEDIIMAVTDMTQERKLVARPARIPHNWYKKYIMSMDLVKLVANNDINKTYLYSLLKYSNFSDEVKNHANGVNVLHLNPQNIEQFELVVASEPLRNNFGEFAKRIFNQIDVLYLKNENLKQTRDILLPRLISGEIDVENMEIA